MRLALLALLVPALLPHPTAAQAVQAASPECQGETQADLNECAAKSFRVADAALNATYRRLAARLSTDSAKRSLVEAQRAWVRFRDAECDFGTSVNEGGSIRPMMVSGCMEGLTRQRTADLEAYMHCTEANCMVPLR